MKISSLGPFCVWSSWALMTLGALAFVHRYATYVPRLDDWAEVVPELAGQQPITPSWLWHQHAGTEHRLPVPKTILLALVTVSGGDFRAPLYFNVIALSTLALAMIRAAARLRGRSSFADAFFPLVLLHWAQTDTYLWAFILHPVSVTLLAGTLLLLVVTSGREVPRARTFWIVACLVLLYGCGGQGLPFLPPFAIWLGYRAVLCLRSTEPGSKRQGVVMLGVAAVTLVLVGVYFIDYERSEVPPSPSLRASLRAALQFCAMIFAGLARPLWPLSGLTVFTGLAIYVLALVYLLWRYRPPERSRALGLLLFMTTFAGSALAVGWGRAGYGWEAGFGMRYVTFGALPLCCTYFGVLLYGSLAVTRLLHAGLCTLALLVLPFHTVTGVEEGRALRKIYDALEEDLEAGLPVRALSQRYALWCALDEAMLSDRLHMLRDAGIEPYSNLQDEESNFRVVRLANPLGVGATWEDGVGRGASGDSYLLFTPHKPGFVCGIRIRYRYPEEETGKAYFRLLWKGNKEDEFTDLRRALHRYVQLDIEAGPEDKVLTIWIYDTVGQFRILPDGKAWTFQIKEIVLLATPP